MAEKKENNKAKRGKSQQKKIYKQMWKIQNKTGFRPVSWQQQG